MLSLLPVALAAPLPPALLDTGSLVGGGGLEAITLKGYAEVRGSWTDAEETHWGAVERLRPTVELQVHDRVLLAATAEAALEQGRYPTGEFAEALREPIETAVGGLSGDGPTLEEVIEDCGWPIETERTYDEVGDVLSLERLYVDVTSPYADFRLGRQAVNWGSALFFNPTDIFAENLVAAPWQERAGVDAARVTVPLGDLAQVAAIGAIFDPFEEERAWRAAAKGTVHVGTADVSLVGSTDGQTHFGGLDVKGDAVVGWWVEGGYDDHVEVSVGADYSFDVLNLLYVAAQVYFDSSGEIPQLYDWETRQDPDLRLPPCEDPELQETLMIPEPSEEHRLTLGRWYGLNVLRLNATDNLTISNTTLVNLADWTGLLFPSAAYTVGSRVSLNGGLQYLFGSDGEFRPPDWRLQQSGADLSRLTPTWTALAWARVSL